MKITLLAAALAGAASADLYIPVDRVRRDDSGSIKMRADPTVDNAVEASCRSLGSSFASALPEGPTVFPEFSSNYYKTVSRTATTTWADCAWITSLPDSTYQDYREWNTEAEAVMDDPNNSQFQGLREDDCLDSIYDDDAPCRTEWLDYVEKVVEDGGLFVDNGTSTTSPSVTGSPKSTDASGKPKSTDASGSPDAPAGPNASGDDGSAASIMAVQTYAVAALLATFVGAVALF